MSPLSSAVRGPSWELIVIARRLAFSRQQRSTPPHHLANGLTRRARRRGVARRPRRRSNGRRGHSLSLAVAHVTAELVVVARRRSLPFCPLADVKIDPPLHISLIGRRHRGGARRLVFLVVDRRDRNLLSASRQRGSFRLGSRSRQYCLRAASSPAPISSLPPRLLTPSSCLCHRFESSCSDLLLSSLQHRLRLRLLPPLLPRL